MLRFNVIPVDFRRSNVDRRPHGFFAATLLFGVLTLVGCSSNEPTHPVRGIVRFSDGQLLREGTVEFEITGRKDPIVARGQINPDGSYTLGTFAMSDGAVAGEHRVVVIADSMIGNGTERPGMLPEQKLHPKHRSFRTSGIRATVKEGKNDIAIDVDYAENKNGLDSTDDPQDE